MTDTINILVLEDDHEDIIFIRKTLEKIHNIEFQIVSTIKDFYSNIDRSIHICVLDYTLPNNGGFTGIDVARELKKRNTGTSILFFTGMSNPNTIIEMNNCCDCKIIGKWQTDEDGMINCFERLRDYIKDTIVHARANVSFINYLMSKQQ